ncbi:copper transporter [Phycicoccus sp. CSK15P-2]|uniref:copper transporter n=1 Tax=Phycicoccus sp. CSK15P-2 TaxID=2807627 RepID=UPI00194DC08A|nr:copper transporter [Phycicoccus sp. CSK15P-2]MBM6403707.1 copper transporter [Phycicoccus sp. CSK15P-2]
MIDFRYHIVSIASIFLALAVGIVLGAGPLKGEIGSTLQSEVAGLRDDKTQLNDQLTAARAAVEQRDAYLSSVSDRVVRGALDTRRVALVVLPGADAAVSETVLDAVTAAGGEVVSTTSVAGEWVTTDEDAAATRDDAVAQVAQTSGVDISAPGSAQPRDVLLATLLARSGDVQDPGPGDTASRNGLDGLADAGLISLDAPEFARADLVVVVSGVVGDGDETVRTETARRWVDLASALDSASRGAVVVTDAVAGSEEVSVVATLRADASTAGEVSGVDDAGDPTGITSTVFALAEQADGGAGQYGLEPSADAPFAPAPGS